MPMNWPHFHLLINHFPIIGGIVALLVMLHGIYRKNHEIVKLSLLLWVFLALMSIVVYVSGSYAGDEVKHFPGVEKKYVDRHDNSATFSITALEVLGGLSLAGLWFYKERDSYPASFIKAMIALALITLGIVGWTSNLGGQIRYPETRPGFQMPVIPPGEN